VRALGRSPFGAADAIDEIEMGDTEGCVIENLDSGTGTGSGSEGAQ
jgi:hypothetical protein